MTPDSLRQEISALDKAEWTSWPHAYGKAGDTPGHLAALLADDEDTRREAALHFSSAIVHQTTVWPSSPDAFGWLVRVLRVKPLPDTAFDECVGALVEAAEYLGEVPADGPLPELSGGAREWLARFGRTPDDDHELVWEEFFESGFDGEVYDWVLARMAGLRPAVLQLAAELAERAPKAGEDLRAAWQAG